MPVIAKFYGIIITMYFGQSEHNPPHLHAKYNGKFALICIRDGAVLDGDLPEKALKLVEEWIELHRDDLLDIWETQEFRKVKPL